MNCYIGKHVEFTDLVKRLEIEIDPDPGTRGKVVSANTVTEFDGEVWDITVDLSFWVDHNKSVALPDWYDENRKPCLKWHETRFYPKHHIYSFYYEPTHEESIFKLVDIDEQMQKAADIIKTVQ